MVTLAIDDREITVDAGTTILEAARRLGIRIPTLCHVEGFPPSASCFLCAVQVDGRESHLPSCAAPVSEGLKVRTNSDEIRASRRMALELLLSDHAGDCIGPCRSGCPARFDIPGFLTEVAAGRTARSAEIASDFLTLPGALGRICPRLCEQRCHHCDKGDALAVGSLHRFAADTDLESDRRYVPRREPASGKRAAVVGAGPGGLTAAYHLLRRGHAVTIFDAHDAPGGMLRYGIPAFRLPRRMLAQEIDIIRLLGGEFRMRQRLGSDLTLDGLRNEYDAVFLAIGAQGSRGLDCPGEELALPAVDFLAETAKEDDAGDATRRPGLPPPLGASADRSGGSEGGQTRLGSRVLVLGGGNTAMDASRTAVRLGAESVTVLYRRSRREMPCLMSEVEAAEAEGVRVETLAAPVRLERSSDGTLHLSCVRMQLGAPDESGRPRPVPIPGSEFTIDASCVIAAIGQTVEGASLGAGALKLTARGIAADPATLSTSVPGVFAGGDAVTGADLAVRAVAAGRLAAVSIDQYLGGRPVVGDPEMVNVLIGHFDDLELAEFYRTVEESPRAPMPELPAAARVQSFDEVELGFSAEVAHAEASRCATCGCWKASTCQLRQYATEYGADPSRYAGARRRFSRDLTHPEIVYEPGKCILCGACVKAASEAADGLGLAIVGRGFEAAVAVPLRGTLLEGLPTAARRAAEVCPTAAIALRSEGNGTCFMLDPGPALNAGGRKLIPLVRDRR